MIITIPVRNELDDYLDFCNNFIFPIDGYSVDYKKTYALDEVISFKNNNSINAYVVINKPIFNSDLKDLENILLKIDESSIDGVLFYDLSILEIKRRLNLKIDLIWNNTHMVTNYKTCDFYYDKGCKYGVLSNEITIDEIKEISINTKMKLWMMVIGYPVMAFSRRGLLTNHAMAHDLDVVYDLKVIEHSTKTKYDVFESEFGTSFRKDGILNGSSVVKDLNIDGIIFKEEDIEHDLFIRVLELFKKYFNKDIEYEEFTSLVTSLIGSDTNFLYNETYYQVKRNE